MYGVLILCFDPGKEEGRKRKRRDKKESRRSSREDRGEEEEERRKRRKKSKHSDRDKGKGLILTVCFDVVDLGWY
jgi:hypothetical protein